MLFIDQTKWHHGWRTSWTLSKRSSLQCDTCRGLARWSFIGSLNKYLILRPLTKIFRGDLLSAPCTIALHRDPAQQLLPESQHETARGFSTTAAALKKRSCCCLLTLTTPLFLYANIFFSCYNSSSFPSCALLGSLAQLILRKQKPEGKKTWASYYHWASAVSVTILSKSYYVFVFRFHTRSPAHLDIARSIFSSCFFRFPGFG